jgi:hypothetical protein
MFVAGDATPSHYDGVMPERAKTAIVAVAVVVVAAVTLIAGTGSGGSAAGDTVRLHTLPGSLLYATPTCAVRRLSFSGLRSTAVTADGGHCRFWPSPDGRRLAMHVGRPFARPAPLQVLDLQTGQMEAPFARPDFAVAPPAWSPGSDILAACDASGPGGDVIEWRTGGIAAVFHRACFPGFVGGRLTYRVSSADGGRVMIGWETVADPGMLGRLLDEGVYQVPGIAAAGDVLAVPATRIATEPGAATTVIVFFNPAGHTVGRWYTGVPVRQIGLLAGGRLVWYRGASGVVARAVSGSRLLGAGLHAVAVAASPDGRTAVFSTGSRLVFVDTAGGRTLGTLPVRAGWLAWTQAGTSTSSSGV